MQGDPPYTREDVDPPDPDPRLEAIAAAILDGTPIDWQNTLQESDPGILDQLRVLADLTALHRSLTPEPGGGAVAENELTPVQGVKWGSLTLQERIGRGAFGEVFRAWDTRLHRDVALKLLYRDTERRLDPDASIREGRLLARVRHPNVLIVYGADRIDGRVGIWTEFIQGRTLAHFIHEHGRFSPDEAAAIGIDLCAALSAVHAAGLLHRDLKPQNVMREQGGRIVLMDFGAGKERPEKGTALNADRAGTPLYLAPELWDDAQPTTRSDVYSLGVLLFYLVSESYPVTGATADAVRDAHHAGRRSLLRDVRPDAPDPFIDVVERALATDPNDRFQTAGELGAALRRLQGSLKDAVGIPPSPAVAAPPRPLTRPGRWMLAAGVIVTIGSVVLMLEGGRIRNRWFSRDGPNAAPAGAAASTTTRKLSPPLMASAGRPSRDGRYLPYTDYPAGDLWYWEIATGLTHQVTRKPTGSAEEGGSSVMSPDGSRIAYMWWTLDGAYDLRVVSADGTQPRVILPRGAADLPVPLEWSADGTQILCLLEHKDGRVDLSLVPADGGALRILQTFGRGQPRQVSLSPDGRFVVYDFPRDFRSLQSQLVILGTDGSPPHALIDEPNNNMNPFWTPDGAHVFFTSDRSGSMDGWVVEVSDGVARGEPTLVARNLALVQPVALTSDGVYHYWLDTSALEVFTVPVDLGAGTPPTSGKPTRVSAGVVGGHVGPDWSADGRSLAYVTRVPSTGTNLNRGANRITILDTVSGRRRDVVPQLSALNIASPRWSPDGRSVIVRGTSLENRMGYFQVDMTTGEAAPILLIDSPNNESDYGAYHVSADGRALLFIHTPRGIVAHDLSSGQEAIVIDRKTHALTGLRGFAASPDGSSLAFSAGTGQGQTSARGVFVQISGGPPRELFRVKAPEFAVVQMWTPDSQEVLFTRFRQGQDALKDPHQLWTVSASGGEPRDTGVRIPGFTNFYPTALSSDGRRLAYTVGQTAAELWSMEKFLPDVPGASARQ